MTEYYVSSKGSNSNNGTSEQFPWQDLTKVRSALLSGVITRTDSILFKRGEEFYGMIQDIPNITVTSTNRLIVGAYGVGPKPIINGYKILNNSNSWTLDSSGIWKINIIDSVSYTGNTMTVATNVGFILVDGKIKMNKKWAKDSTMVNQWDFFTDDTFLYVKSTENPTSLASDIRVAVDKTGIVVPDSVLVAGLNIKGFGAHGISVGSKINTRVVGCDIHEIGGSQLGTGTVRYGNGIQVWIGARDHLSEYNNLYDIFEVATTMQGPQTGAFLGWENCHFKNNKIWNCGQSFETWATGTDLTSPTSGFKNCSFTNNICINAGFSWSETVKAQPGIGTHLLNYNMQLPVDIKISENVFFDAKDNFFFVNTNNNAVPSGYSSDKNIIFLREQTKIQKQKTQTIENYSSWVNETGLEKNSEWIKIPNNIFTIDEAFDFISSQSALTSAQNNSFSKNFSEVAAQLAIIDSMAENKNKTISPNIMSLPMTGTLSYSAHGVSSIGNTTYANGLMSGWRFMPEKNTTLGKISIWIATAGSAGSVVRLGVYKLNMQTSTVAGTLLFDAGTVDASVSGVKSITINQPVIAGELYLVVAVTQGSPTTLPILKSNQGHDAGIGGIESVTTVTRLMGFSSSGVNDVLPSSTNFVVAGDVPRTTIAGI